MRRRPLLPLVVCGCAAAAATVAPTDDEQRHQQRQEQQQAYNLLRLDDHYNQRGTTAQTITATSQKRSLRRFRHNNHKTVHHGREEAGAAHVVAAAAFKGEAETRGADYKQMDIFDHTQEEGLNQIQRDPRTGYHGAIDSQETKESASDGDGPQEVEKDPLQEQTNIREHELSTCLSTLAKFATNSFGQSANTGTVGGAADAFARHPSAQPSNLITKESIMNLLSDAALTAAASSPDGRSSEVVIDVQWTDLPLSLIMEYNFYASCYSDAAPSPGRRDGVCTAGGEGLTNMAVGDDAGQGEASVFDLSRRQWLRRRNDNGDKGTEQIIDVTIETQQGRGVDWPLRMLCREITSYTHELAAATSSFLGQNGHNADAIGSEESPADVELHYTFAITNVTHSFFHSKRNGRTGPFSDENGVVGRIRQRAMLKQLIVIATESIIRQILGCSASTSIEEEDILSLVAVKDGHEKEMQEKELGRANSGATWSHRYHTEISSPEKARGDAMNSSSVNERAASPPEKDPQESKQIPFEDMGAKDPKIALFGGCDISLFVNVDSLQKISCQDQYSFGCASIEMSAYIWAPHGSTGDLLSANGGDIKSELLRAIEKSIQSGGFGQLMGI